MNEYLKRGDRICLRYIYDDGTSEINKFDPPIIIPDDKDMDEVKEFSLNLGSIISYEIYKQSYKPIIEIGIIKDDT